MAVIRSNHCTYDTHYHLVFPLKYRKALLEPEITAVMYATLHQIAERYELVIEQAGDDKDHIHLLVSFHPKYDISRMVQLLKGITARELFKARPELKKDLWGGEFWSDGYYAAMVGTGGNWQTVERYVKNQGQNAKDNQLTIWT